MVSRTGSGRSLPRIARRGLDARRERELGALNGALQLFDQRGGFFVG
jgi:hypothetical protein